MARSCPEWIGKTPETRCPPRVRVRIFDREGGKCHECGRLIRAGEKWQADHRPALINGGENRESKMFPIHIDCHKDRTKADVAEKKKVASVRSKHIGAVEPAAKIPSRGFAKKAKPHEGRQQLPPRSLFKPAQEAAEQ